MTPAPIDLDDAVRQRVSAALVDAGVQPASLPSLFARLDSPSPAGGQLWAWLRSDAARRDGAALVLLLEHQAAVLLTAAEGRTALRSRQSVLVIDVGRIVEALERQTGVRYL